MVGFSSFRRFFAPFWRRSSAFVPFRRYFAPFWRQTMGFRSSRRYFALFWRRFDDSPRVLRKVCHSFAEGVILRVTPSAQKVLLGGVWGTFGAEGVPHKNTPSAQRRKIRRQIGIFLMPSALKTPNIHYICLLRFSGSAPPQTLTINKLNFSDFYGKRS